MKVFLLISYLIGGIIIPIQLNNMPPITETVTVDTVEQQPVSLTTHTQEAITLNKVNNISLYDDASTVIEKLGDPDHISTDPYFAQYEMYEYSNMTISFSEDLIDSLEVQADATTITLDQVELPITIEALLLALGAPDYVAEDGLVFQRDEAVLKLFIDQDSKQLQSIAFYHIAST